jgi:hypothetical protein
MKTHPLSVTHLVMGLVFLGIAGSWVLHETGVTDGQDITWLFPMALVVAGGVGLVAAMAKGVTGRRRSTPYAEQPETTTDDLAYDPPLMQDYTSDLDRKLRAAETSPTSPTTVIPTATDDTAVIDTDTEEKDR